MIDFLIGLAFVAMIVILAVVASVQGTKSSQVDS